MRRDFRPEFSADLKQEKYLSFFSTIWDLCASVAKELRTSLSWVCQASVHWRYPSTHISPHSFSSSSSQMQLKSRLRFLCWGLGGDKIWEGRFKKKLLLFSFAELPVEGVSGMIVEDSGGIEGEVGLAEPEEIIETQKRTSYFERKREKSHFICT